MAIEEPKYQVLESQEEYEVRLYEPQVQAFTHVDEADWQDAANQGFRRIAGFIFGKNSRNQRISMTAPVGVQAEKGGHEITFVMPAEHSLDGLPKPEDSRVVLRLQKARKVAAIRFSGRSSEANTREHLEKLRSWMKGKGLVATGEPIWAGYNPPWTLWFLRRNEILIPLN